MNPKPLSIRAEWDNEALAWLATSDDVPGLATEADTFENLVHKFKIVIPELLEMNGIEFSGVFPMNY
jgi:predicted RNase H-like HicB family nuclease